MEMCQEGVGVLHLTRGSFFWMKVDFSTIVQKSYHSGLFIGASTDLLQ